MAVAQMHTQTPTLTANVCVHVFAHGHTDVHKTIKVHTIEVRLNQASLLDIALVVVLLPDRV